MGSQQAEKQSGEVDIANLGFTPVVRIDAPWTVEKAAQEIPGGAPTEGSTSPLPFFHILERLKTTKREGWRRFGITRGESIADHMYRMSMISMFAPPALVPKLDLPKCIKMCLIHDVAELLVGDITPVDGVPKAEKSRREASTMDFLTKNLLRNVAGGTTGEDLRAIWQEYEDSETLDSHFVHDVDKLELLLQMMEYEKRGEGKLDLGEFAYVATKVALPEMKVWADEVLKEREDFWGSKKHIHGENGEQGGVETQRLFVPRPGELLDARDAAHIPSMAVPSHFHMPGAFHAEGVHPGLFRPPMSPSSSTNLSYTGSRSTASADTLSKRKRHRNEISRSQEDPGEMEMDNGFFATPGTQPRHDESRYHLAGQLDTPNGGPFENGILGESMYSDFNYRKALGSKREREEMERSSLGPMPLFTLPSQPPASQGWGSFAFNTLGGVVGRVWEFCTTSAFRGFHAGGGRGFEITAAGVQETSDYNEMLSHGNMASPYDIPRYDERPSGNRHVPGRFPQAETQIDQMTSVGTGSSSTTRPLPSPPRIARLPSAVGPTVPPLAPGTPVPP
ncbi:hypothetical protein G7046_g3219 [Stylonectria norvegica]|nr:hypothetical protein G7046_g3219 [Stylonectria norvegica]